MFYYFFYWLIKKIMYWLKTIICFIKHVIYKKVIPHLRMGLQIYHIKIDNLENIKNFKEN